MLTQIFASRVRASAREKSLNFLGSINVAIAVWDIYVTLKHASQKPITASVV
jgi:hypothetical protein